MDPIKGAFLRIKEDISQLREEIEYIKQNLIELHNSKTFQTYNQAQEYSTTDQQTVNKDTQTHKLPLESFSSKYIDTSIGNEGVPTDRLTDEQTNRHSLISTGKPIKTEFERASEALESLDSIKKEIRLKFKQLTKQEMLVFSSLYALEEQKMPEITYKVLADSLKLSESSIRDYIHKLAKKGVPILKTRLNNKTILLNIDPNLKNIATLETILKLRDI